MIAQRLQSYRDGGIDSCTSPLCLRPRHHHHHTPPQPPPRKGGGKQVDGSRCADSRVGGRGRGFWLNVQRQGCAGELIVKRCHRHHSPLPSPPRLPDRQHLYSYNQRQQNYRYHHRHCYERNQQHTPLLHRTGMMSIYVTNAEIRERTLQTGCPTSERNQGLVAERF